MLASLRRLGRAFRGRDARDAADISGRAWRAEGAQPTAVAAFECALVDALCRAEGIPFHRFFGGVRRDLKTLMSVSAVDPALVSARVRAGRRQGFDAFKLKLKGAEPEALNLSRVRAAASAAPKAEILLDPNQSYRPDTLESLLEALRRSGIPVAMVEEPFLKRDWPALRRFRREGCAVPLILDESVQNRNDARRAARGKLADGVNVKLAKSGLFESRRILEEAAALPAPVLMIGCMAESKIGLAAAAQFAMGLGVFGHCDLDSDLLLKPLPIPGGYIRKGPWLTLPKKTVPGLGVSA